MIHNSILLTYKYSLITPILACSACFSIVYIYDEYSSMISILEIDT